MIKNSGGLQSELIMATHIGLAGGEPRQEFLERLARAGRKLSDKAWAKLSDEAQAWVNAAVKAISSEKTIVDLPEPIETPMKSTNKTPAKTVVKANNVHTRVPIVTIIKRMMIKDPGISPREIHVSITKKGYVTTLNNVSSHANDFKHSLRILEEEGALIKSLKFFDRARQRAAK